MVTNTDPQSMSAQTKLLALLQLASPNLPVGAYSYSEGLETLVATGVIQSAQDLQTWLEQELQYGAIRLEAAVLRKGYHLALQERDPVLAQLTLSASGLSQLCDWNAWLSALRETSELRHQSWQMGRALLRLLQDIDMVSPQVSAGLGEQPCNFAISFALAAAYWQLDLESTLLGYLQTWSANLVMAGVKLIPLGQTAGQRLLFNLHPRLQAATTTILALADTDWYACSWGLSFASMQHESQYSRLFRS